MKHVEELHDGQTANPSDFKWFKGLTVHNWFSGQSV